MGSQRLNWQYGAFKGLSQVCHYLGVFMRLLSVGVVCLWLFWLTLGLFSSYWLALSSHDIRVFVLFVMFGDMTKGLFFFFLKGKGKGVDLQERGGGGELGKVERGGTVLRYLEWDKNLFSIKKNTAKKLAFKKFLSPSLPPSIFFFNVRCECVCARWMWRSENKSMKLASICLPPRGSVVCSQLLGLFENHRCPLRLLANPNWLVFSCWI